jgi:hypothetical protein
MRNKIEILRAVCFTKEDMVNYEDLPFEVSDIEMEFMVEFKKIYELGINQLERFIVKLDTEGSQLQPYDVDYYVKQLLNGPYSKYAAELAAGRKYFTPIPDSLGNLINSEVTSSNTSLYTDDATPSETSIDIYNKSPVSMQKMIDTSSKSVEDMFRSSIYTSMVYDNTLPIIDKQVEARYEQERFGNWQQTSHGSYNVKDSYYRMKMDAVRSDVAEIVKSDIGNEQFRIFEDKKTYSPFSPYTNDGYSENFVFKKKLQSGNKTTTFQEDIFGEVFDDRDTKINIEKKTKNLEFYPNTVEGQLSVNRSGRQRKKKSFVSNLSKDLISAGKILNIAERNGFVVLGEFGVSAQGVLNLGQQLGINGGRQILIKAGGGLITTVGRSIFKDSKNPTINKIGDILNPNNIGISAETLAALAIDGKLDENVVKVIGAQAVLKLSDNLIATIGSSTLDTSIGKAISKTINTVDRFLEITELGISSEKLIGLAIQGRLDKNFAIQLGRQIQRRVLTNISGQINGVITSSASQLASVSSGKLSIVGGKIGGFISGQFGKQFGEKVGSQLGSASANFLGSSIGGMVTPLIGNLLKF